jgi:hypothetical protein
MPTVNSGGDFPAPSLGHPGRQYLLAPGCDRMAAGRTTQQAWPFPVGV